jgi:hypothetical protein
MSAPTSSYATAGTALRVSGALKPHHHDKVETRSVGKNKIYPFEFRKLKTEVFTKSCRWLQKIIWLVGSTVFRESSSKIPDNP